jgi:hypothetical protein
MTRSPWRLAVSLLACALPVGCAHAGIVERAYDGDVVDGRYVPPEAYAAFLRGAMAEAEGHPKEALAAYAEAARRDPRSPEPWTRIAEIQCADGAREHASEAARAIARALELAPSDPKAWAARARCAAARGDAADQSDAAARAAALDPEGDGANILFARSPSTQAALSREALLALTITARDPPAAWSALAEWAEAHGDVALATRALVELARAAPERWEAIGRAAEPLAGNGNVAEGRVVASAALDAAGGPWPERLALAARLAVDEAIGRRDLGAVRRRATRARLPLDEAAGRALLAGDRALARDVAAVVAAADPTALGARLVIAVVDGNDFAVAASARAPDTPAASAAVVAFGAAAIHGGASAQMRAAIAAIPREPVVAGDDRVVRAAVELVSRGALPADALPPDGSVELAVMQGAAPPGPVDPDDRRLDLRHRFLAGALARPDAAAVRELGVRLRALEPLDPIIGVGAALLQLASTAPVSPDAPRALLARNPADPLLAATALRLAERVGDTEVARRARETLSALGKARKAVE